MPKREGYPVDKFTIDQAAEAMAKARKSSERVAEDSCAWGRAQGWKVRWEWRGNSVWMIDETQRPYTEYELFDVVPLPEALADLEAQGNG